MGNVDQCHNGLSNIGVIFYYYQYWQIRIRFRWEDYLFGTYSMVFKLTNDNDHDDITINE